MRLALHGRKILLPVGKRAARGEQRDRYRAKRELRLHHQDDSPPSGLPQQRAAFEPIIASPGAELDRAEIELQGACDTRRMTDRTTLCDELTATWHREIPIVAAMDVTVEDRKSV